MPTLCSPGRGRLVAAGLAALLCACQAAPPLHRVSTPAGAVRAGEPERARRMADALEELAPRVAELLPGARPRPVEVWVQDEPRLYRFGKPAHQEADGFWAEAPGRVHLRESADDLHRTLAHELVHAFLGPEWAALPGTLEEGLCDVVSALAAPQGALRMRAGRLSAAAFCIGGLALRVEVRGASAEGGGGIELSYAATIVLEGELERPLAPVNVFEERAGLSSSRMGSARKKALYGLAYLVVSRAAARVGLEGLHALCLRARDEGLPRIPSAWLLEAADLPEDDPAPWRRAIEAELGPDELGELAAMHPAFLLWTLHRLVPGWEDGEALSVRLATLSGGPPFELLVFPPTPSDERPPLLAELR